MSVWCCAGAMGTALSQQEESSADPAEPQPPTMADFMRMRRRKGGALWTLRRRLRRAAPPQPEREAAISRQLRSIVAGWSGGELAALLWLLRREQARGVALATTSPALPTRGTCRHTSCWCDVVISWAGGSVPAHAFVLAARTQYWRNLAEELQPHRVVSLPSSCSSVSRGELLAALRVIYGNEHDSEEDSDECPGLDILDNTADNNEEEAVTSPPPAALLAALGVSRDTFANDMLRMWRDGVLSDCSVSVSSRRFSCHRAILANASRYFRSVVGRGMGSSDSVGGSSSLVIDPLIVPPRFLHALLHSAYSNQVDISLVEPASPPQNNTTTGWGSAKGSKTLTDKLDDVFQLYEIAKFCEMEVCALACERVASSSLTVTNVGAALTWSRQRHASPLVLRSALSFVRSNLVAVLSTSAPPCGSVLWAVAKALSTPGLTCSDDTAARALLHFYRRHYPESSWLGSGGNSSLLHFLSPFLPHLRTEHLPHNHPLFTLGICSRVSADSRDTWLGRGVWRPPRPLPAYINTLQSMVDGSVSEAEVQQVLRANTMPDTLYMVGGSRNSSSETDSLGDPPEGSDPAGEVPAGWVSPARGSRLVSRVRRLLADVPAPYRGDTYILRYLCARAVMELGLPAKCWAAALSYYLQLTRGETTISSEDTRSRDVAKEWTDSGEMSAVTTGTSLRLHSQRDSRRRELPAVVSEGQLHSVGRLVPDVAAPDGNTHLLYPATGPVGRVLTLDLGDGALHAPQRGSRAHRATRSRGDGQGHPRGRTRTESSHSELDLPDAAAFPVYPPRRLSPSPTHSGFTLQPHFTKHNTHVYGESSHTCEQDTFAHENYLNSDKNERFTREKYLNSDKSKQYAHENYTNFEQNKNHRIPCPSEFENSTNRKRISQNDDRDDFLRDDSDFFRSGLSDSNEQSQWSSYRDLKTPSDLYTTKLCNIQQPMCKVDFIGTQNNLACHLETKHLNTNSLQRNLKLNSNTLELYSGKSSQNQYQGQSTSKEQKFIKSKDFIDCTLPKNCGNFSRRLNETVEYGPGCSLPTECITEKQYYTKSNNQTYAKGDFFKHKSKDTYKDRKCIDSYQEFRNNERSKDRELKQTNQNYTIDDIEMKSLKIHCDSYMSGKDYHSGSLKIHKGKSTQNLGIKNVTKDYNTLTTRIDSCGSISSHGTLLPRSNSSLSGRNSAQSSQSGHISAQSGHTSAQSGHISAQSGHTSAQSGHTSAQSGHMSAHSGHTSAQSGHTSAQSGHMSAHSGHTSAQSGHISHTVTGRSSPRSGVFSNSPLSSIGHLTPPHTMGSYSSQNKHLLGVNTQNNTPNHSFSVANSHGSPSIQNVSHKYQSGHCEMAHSSSLEYVVRDGSSPRTTMSPRESVSSRDGDRVSPRDTLRDVSSRDTLRDTDRVRHPLPGHVRPRSKEREPLFTLHNAHTSHPSDTRSTNIYRVESADIGLPRSSPRNH